MKRDRVSIIIPLFNRSKLIRETLNSILKQNYQNWECIVVDDGSTDNSVEVVEGYCFGDSRIKVYKRPDELLKGANNCRNYGFSKSSGKFIIWFDSDDLMTPNHLKSKLKAIQAGDLDFIVAKTQNFKGSEILEPYKYVMPAYGIKASDFILLKIHWYTYDVILSRKIAERISWNEKMKSWQDYNYFCKMVLITEKGSYLDEVLTYRRLHEESIQTNLNRDIQTFNSELLENRLLTYNDINEYTDPQTQRELIFGMMNLCFELAKSLINIKYVKEVTDIVESELGKASKFHFKLAMSSARLLNKGHYFLNRAKQR